jgi:ABC-type amino acid transport substrate-binding protein
MRPATRRLAAWIAGLAVLFGALAPTLARAMAAGPGDAAWTEICTGAGMVRVAVPADSAPDESGSGSGVAGIDCPYCQTHAGSFALPPAPRAVVPVAELFRPLPELAYSSPRPLFAWAASRPRAPPSVS